VYNFYFGFSDFGQVLFITSDGASNMSAGIHEYEHVLRDRFVYFDSLTQHQVYVV